jgi:pimeloyl-ACP methyl ester carboxylesterase
MHRVVTARVLLVGLLLLLMAAGVGGGCARVERASAERRGVEASSYPAIDWARAAGLDAGGFAGDIGRGEGARYGPDGKTAVVYIRAAFTQSDGFVTLPFPLIVSSEHRTVVEHGEAEEFSPVEDRARLRRSFPPPGSARLVQFRMRGGGGSVLDSALTFRLRRQPEGAATRGVVVWMSSLGGQEYERPVLAELYRRGWTVLSTNTVPVGAVRGDFLFREGAGLEEGARAIAAYVDGGIAPYALASEAALELLGETGVAGDCPVVVVGCSAGGLLAPAVACRLEEVHPGRVRAMVLVGAGANAVRIGQESGFTNGGINLHFLSERRGKVVKRRASRDQRRAVAEAYEGFTRLDPAVLAPRLRGLPVLMVHARGDEIVPAATGDRLWELLGRPDRRSYFFGHELLFWMLPGERGAIAAWVDARVPAGG